MSASLPFLHRRTWLSPFACVLVACGTSVATGAGGAGGGSSSSHASATASTGAGGIPEPTKVCTSFVAGGTDGGNGTTVAIGTGQADMFTPFVDGQTLQLEWGFQGLQHFPFTARAANATDGTIAFVELVPDSGGNHGLVELVMPACDGWSEVVGNVMPLPMPEETYGKLVITVGTCPSEGCDATAPGYGFTSTIGSTEVANVHVLPPAGPQPGSGGAGGFFGG